MLVQVAAVVGIAAGAVAIWDWWKHRNTFVLDANLPPALVKQVIAALLHEEDPVKLDALATQLVAYPLASKLLKEKAAQLRSKALKANPPPAPPKNVIYNPPPPPSPVPAPIVEPVVDVTPEEPHIDPPVYVPPAPAGLPPMPTYPPQGNAPGPGRGASESGGSEDNVRD